MLLRRNYDNITTRVVEQKSIHGNLWFYADNQPWSGIDNNRRVDGQTSTLWKTESILLFFTVWVPVTHYVTSSDSAFACTDSAFDYHSYILYVWGLTFGLNTLDLFSTGIGWRLVKWRSEKQSELLTPNGFNRPDSTSSESAMLWPGAFIEVYRVQTKLLFFVGTKPTALRDLTRSDKTCCTIRRPSTSTTKHY